MPAQMKAMVIEQQGSPAVIRNQQLPVPELGAGEVLIKVRGCALNHLDIWCRSGLPGVKLPLILGCDVAGEIVEMAKGVNHLQIGDKILVDPGLACGNCRPCLAGQENLCRYYHILGAGRNGGYAEYVNVPAVNCFPIPNTLNFHQAAALPLVFLTAWHMLISRCGLQSSDTVLIVGGSSGVGTAAIQIAKLFHCRVITTVGNEEKANLAKKLGADEIIIHSQQQIAKEVKRLTDKRGVDIVFEHVGPAVMPDCLASLAINGRLVTCGATTGPKIEIDVPRLFMKHQSILGSIMGTKDELFEMLPLFEKGLLKPIIDKIFPLAEAKAAHEYMETREHFGKIVLDPQE